MTLSPKKPESPLTRRLLNNNRTPEKTRPLEISPTPTPYLLPPPPSSPPRNPAIHHLDYPCRRTSWPRTCRYLHRRRRTGEEETRKRTRASGRGGSPVQDAFPSSTLSHPYQRRAEIVTASVISGGCLSVALWCLSGGNGDRPSD
ncbi:hypothetical protein GWI33_009531 [Rhynchophorus ferrugineus]|uniref:Uncharacterized protein n=1 Tax=Rhynchophorus ferrugineus TaxID=354439 RepID=A0A834MNL1_RHYFE|nr:hypothetical protein GWI33_009531 [Rhynchophorus ferrugineus]